MKMSETRELQNQRALARLTRALPDNFPASVLTYALNRRWHAADALAGHPGSHTRCARYLRRLKRAPPR